jgi:methionyl-tRNA synthetase
MPNKMREVRSVFGLDDSTLSLDNARKFFELEPGCPVHLEKTIFPRLEKKRPADSKPRETKKSEDGLLDIADFSRAKLRVAQVISAEKVEGTDKLLKLQIDLGKEQRQIVAGVAQFYTPEQITGKKITVVTNLKPAKIRGVESNGMLLAAKSGEKLFLLTPDGDLPPGAKIS